MALRLYNTLTRHKEDFRPLDADNVRVYVCGPTVYDFAHIGNARPVIVFDVLFRLLLHLAKQGIWDGGKGETKVSYVRNITDVDDKINARAARRFPKLPLNEAIGRVTEGTLRQFHADVAELGCLEPTVEPRATGHIDDMKTLIERLVEKNCAYVEQDHVLFRVASMPDYGVLANRSLDEMLAGARVEVAPYKRDAMDFVLWKPSSPGEPAWPAPCGIETPGRPGWHIECSAMSWRHLGETFDIHGGGIDLMFPHHENELAQSRCALGVERMASVWMHNGFLQVEGRKMAKSEGNFVTINELLNTNNFGGRPWSGSVLRLSMLRTHYRQPIDWTVEQLLWAEETLYKWRAFSGERTTKRADKHALEHFTSFLLDDLNVPGAIAVIDEVVSVDNPSPAERAFVFSALQLLGFKSPLTRAKRAAESLTTVNRLLSGMDIAEVQRIVEKAHQSPTYQNGQLRPETKLIAALKFFQSIVKSRGLDSIPIRPNIEERYREALTHIDIKRLDKLLEDRSAARNARNWLEADRIRDELAALGVVLHDTKEGTTWELKR